MEGAGERFERLREVGAGAFGVVYQARDRIDGSGWPAKPRNIEASLKG